MGQCGQCPQTLGWNGIIHAQGDGVVVASEIFLVQVYVG